MSNQSPMRRRAAPVEPAPVEPLLRAPVVSLSDVHEPARARIAAIVAARGLNPVARALGVDRAALASYLTGRARRGTNLLVQTLLPMVFPPEK
jgi:hypothetical protein